MLLFLGLLVAAPFLAFADYLTFMKMMEARTAELTKASHGVAFIVIAWIAFREVQDDPWISFEHKSLIYFMLGLMGCWGLFWLAVGTVRSRGARDFRLIGRAVAKIFVPAALFVLITWNTRTWSHEFAYWRDQIGFAVSLWCVVTGFTKLVLLMREPPGLTTHGGNDPYGGAGFGSGMGG